MKNKLDIIIESLVMYENKFLSTYWELYDNRNDDKLDFNIEGRKIFLNTIEELRKIRPISDYKIIKDLKYEGEKFRVLDLDYLKSLLIIKKLIIKGEWFDVINNFLNLNKNYNILQEKLYYNIINII